MLLAMPEPLSLIARRAATFWQACDWIVASLTRPWMETSGEVCLICGSITLYTRSDYYFSVKEE